jgi:hypothetical protein
MALTVGKSITTLTQELDTERRGLPWIFIPWEHVDDLLDDRSLIGAGTFREEPKIADQEPEMEVALLIHI